MTSWESLGGGFSSGPGACSWAAGRLDVVGSGLDGACWHTWYENGWNGWESLGGVLTSEPDAVAWSAGRIDVVGRGTDDACWHTWYDNGWSGWESLGGGCASGPGICSWAPGRLDVVVQGTDTACWHKWYDNGWSDWENLGGGFTSEIDAVSWGDGRIDLFGRGTDNACWHKWYDNGWSDWESLGGGFSSGITAASWDAGRLDLFGQGLDGACWHAWYDPNAGWSGWESLGGHFTSGLAAVSWSPGRIDVFGRGDDNATWHTWYDNGTWADWSAPVPVGTDVKLPVLDVVRVDALELPTFDPAVGATLQSTPVGDVAAVDGTAWRTLTGWLQPREDSGVTVLCRKTGLSIRVQASGAAAKLLPLTENSPSLALSYGSGSGAARAEVLVPMEAAVDVANGTLMAVLPFADAKAYGAMVKVLSDSSSGVELNVSYGHSYLVQQPVAAPADPPPPPPPADRDQSPPIFVPPDRLDRLGRGPLLDRIRDGIDPRRLRLQPFMAQSRAVPDDAIAPGTLRSDDLTPTAFAAVPAALVTRLDRRTLLSVASTNPRLLTVARLHSRDWSRIIVRPPAPTPGQPAVTEAVLQSSFRVGVYRPLTDLATYPDVPRVDQQGWGQVPGRPADQPVLHFKDSERPDVFYTLPTRFKLGFFRGADPEGGDDLEPIRVTQYLAEGQYRVKVALVAVPYLSDADRRTLTTHLRDVVLRQMLPYVALEPRAGLQASFVPSFSAGSGTAKEVLPETITFSAEEVLPDRRLSLRFDMDAMHYGIFCELLRKGIRGRVVLAEDKFTESIDVSLRLDDLISNGVRVESEGFDSVPPADGSTPPVTQHRVRLRNALAYPARLSALQVTCIDRGPVADLVFDAEELDLLTTEQVLAPSSDEAGSSVAFDVVPQRIAVWNDTAVALGTIEVDGGTVQEWLDRVTRDPSLQPQRHAVTLSPKVASGADVKLVRLKLFDATASHLVQSGEIEPTGSSPLVIEVRLADLAGAGTAPPTFVLEYECEYGSGAVSLPQRIEISPTLSELPLSVLFEQPTSVYKLEHGPAGADPVVEDGLSRDAAEDKIGQARTRNERWRVFARLP